MTSQSIEIMALVWRIQRYEDALRFYAAKETYRKPIEKNEDYWNLHIETDEGMRARAVLSEINPFTKSVAIVGLALPDLDLSAAPDIAQNDKPAGGKPTKDR